MPRARFVSPYFGDGMNNLVQALAGDPTADVKAGLLGDKRRETQANQRRLVAEALLDELQHRRTIRDDELAAQGAPALTGMDAAVAELALRGGGNTDQRASGINTLLAANSALGGDPYASMVLQGKEIGPDFSPTPGRADAVSARNAAEDYKQAEMESGADLAAAIFGHTARADASRYGADQRLAGTMHTADRNKEARIEAAQARGQNGPGGPRTPLNVSPTAYTSLREQTGSQLSRRVEELGYPVDDESISAIVDVLMPLVSRYYQETRDTGAAIEAALGDLMSGEFLKETEGSSFLGIQYGQETTVDPSFISRRDQILGGQAPTAPTPAAVPAPSPQAAAPSPVADALTAGVEAFNPEERIAEFNANPANRNMTHEGPPTRELPVVTSREDKVEVLTQAAEAIAMGADWGVIWNKLGMMGFSDEELARLEEHLTKHGIRRPER